MLLSAYNARTGKWENDKSEIRRVDFQYYSIKHFLHTGIIENKAGQRVCSKVTVEDFYKMPELVADERAFVECYLQYLKTLQEEEYLNTPLLIPQFRYGGNGLDYKYRSDFVILNYKNNRDVKKYMIELSREQTHKELGTEDAMRRNDFIKKYSFLTLEFRDTALNKMSELFQNEIVGLLR